MAKVSVSQKIPANAQQVWDMIGNFNGLADWHPGIQKSQLEEGGTVRRLTLPDGSTLVETLVSEDGKERTYDYIIPDGQMPFSGYKARMRVVEDDDGNCTASWESEFEPKAPGAEQMDNDIYQAGFDNLRKMFVG
jgi:hypothetical protein